LYQCRIPVKLNKPFSSAPKIVKICKLDISIQLIS